MEPGEASIGLGKLEGPSIGSGSLGQLDEGTDANGSRRGLEGPDGAFGDPVGLAGVWWSLVGLNGAQKDTVRLGGLG